MPKESIFSVSPSPVKFGPGALGEIGKDAKNLGMRRVALFTDRWVGQLECVETAKRAIAAEGLELVVFDDRGRPSFELAQQSGAGSTREAVLQFDRWEVKAEAQIGLFSFTKYLMWLDLHRRAEEME